jgi:outer membrane lipoprotein SlyB
MKTLALLFALLLIISIALDGCSTPPTQQQIAQGASTAAQIAALAFSTYASAKSGHTDATQIAAIASADLYGAASIAQSYKGTNANVAAVVQGARSAAQMAQVISQLPPGTIGKDGRITPQTAAILSQAASQLAAAPIGVPPPQPAP